MMKKVVIHGDGANQEGRSFIMRSNNIFDIRALVDRKTGKTAHDFNGIPVYPSFDDVRDNDIDYIFVMCQDYDSVLREYQMRQQKRGGTYTILSLRHTHAVHKQKQFCALANEIYRLNVPGSVAELGVDFGDTAKYINLFFEDRTLYLFDTFEGFSQKDIEYERGLESLVEKAARLYDYPLKEADVLNRMFTPSQCVIKRGLFPDSLNGLEDTFAFVHIDCDLSKPIQDALEYFYPRLSKGGYICVHDYFNPDFPGVCPVVSRFIDKHQVKMVPCIGYNGAIITK